MSKEGVLKSQQESKEIIAGVQQQQMADEQPATTTQPSWFEQQMARNKEKREAKQQQKEQELQASLNDWYSRLGGTMSKREMEIASGQKLNDEKYNKYLTSAKTAYDNANANGGHNADENISVLGNGNNYTWGNRTSLRNNASSGNINGLASDLQTLVGSEAIPEGADGRDYIAALREVGELPENATDEQKAEYEANAKRAAMVNEILANAGITIDPETGSYTVNKDAKTFEQELDERVARDNARAELLKMEQDRKTNARMLGTSIGDLTAGIGEMIRGTMGAPVTPRDYAQIYQSLNAEQKAAQDAYVARLDKIREDARKERETRRLEAAAAKQREEAMRIQLEEAEKNRKAKKELNDDTIAGRLEAAKIAANSRQAVADINAAAKEQVARLNKLYGGLSKNSLVIPNADGTTDIANFSKENSGAVFSNVYRILVDESKNNPNMANDVQAMIAQFTGPDGMTAQNQALLVNDWMSRYYNTLTPESKQKIDNIVRDYRLVSQRTANAQQQAATQEQVQNVLSSNGASFGAQYGAQPTASPLSYLQQAGNTPKQSAAPTQQAPAEKTGGMFN